MPSTDYKRDERLQVIHKCLKNNMGKWSVKKLQEKVNSHLENIGGNPVSSRTIADDLKYLAFQKGAPVEPDKKGRSVFYRYSEDFEFNEPAITKEEYLSLLIANEVLSQLKGFTLTKELKELSDKLKLYIDDTIQENDTPVVFDAPAGLKHIDTLQDILECILEKTVLQVSYQPFGVDTPIEKTIHPYFLKQYNQRWFLFGYDEKNDRVDNSPIDRIIDFKPVNRPFIENAFFSQHEYFNNIIGVTKKDGQKPERAVFTVPAKRADYLITKPLHPSQAIIANEKGTVTFEISIIINKELISTLLSFGSDVVVVEPTALKAAVTKEHENALANYNDNLLV